MALKLVSLLLTAVAIPLSSCLPSGDYHPRDDVAAASVLQSAQPLSVSGQTLPSPNGNLRYATLAYGTQNYTCNSTAWVQNQIGDGALAWLVDVTEFLAEDPSAIQTLPSLVYDGLSELATFGLLKDRSYWKDRRDSNPAPRSSHRLARGLPQLPDLPGVTLGLHYVDARVHPVFDLSQADPPSFLSARRVAKIHSDVAGAVDWLYLVDNEDGMTQGDINAVYRVETHGGVPSATCTIAEDGTMTQVLYVAEYWFYG